MIQAIQNGRPVQYLIKDSSGWYVGIILNISYRIEFLVIRDYADGAFFADKLAHTDGNIYPIN